MSGNIGALIFLGIIVGLVILIAGTMSIYYTFQSEKEKKAFRVNKDLAKAKRDYDTINHEYCKLGSEICNIKKEIDVAVARQKYMTKVDLLIQDKELEKLKYRLKDLQTKQDTLRPQGEKLFTEYLELRRKYKLSN